MQPPNNINNINILDLNNPYFNAGFGLIGVAAALAVGRQAIRVGWQLAKRKMLLTLEASSRDVSFPWLLQWVARQHADAHHVAVTTQFRQADSGQLSTVFDLGPAAGVHHFVWRNRLFQAVRNREKVDFQSGAPFETLTLSTISFRANRIFVDILQEAQKAAEQREEGKVVLYTAWG